MTVMNLARPELLLMQAYSSARMEASAGRVWLNANELPWSQTDAAARGLNRYPDPQPTALVSALAELYETAANRVFVGRGSDEAIDLLTRAFCAAGASNIVIAPPVFGMYAVAARVQGAAVREVPLLRERGYAYDPAGVLAAIDAQTRLVYLCNPNNPTGNAMQPGLIEQMAEALRDRALLVVDEAYIEFSDSANGDSVSADSISAIPLLDRFDNLVVLRTLSKAHGLAGARVGVAIAAPEVIELLRRIMPPYPLPSICVEAALAAIRPAALATTRERVALLKAERELLQAALRSAREVVEVLPSSANFLCVRLRDADAAYARLSAEGVIVRSLRKYSGLEDALRISIGTPEENRAALLVLSALMRAA